MAGGWSAGRALLGLALLLPLLAAWLLTLVAPTVATIATSLQDASPFGEAEWVGAANYAHLAADPRFGASLDLTLALARAGLVGVAVLPPLLALGLAGFGRRLQLSVRLLFTLPLALIAPAGAAVAWHLALNRQAGVVGRLLGAETTCWAT